MSKRKKVGVAHLEQQKEKPTPAFLRKNYPYKAVGDELKPEECEDGATYEIKCCQCQMSIRSQGKNICSIWERMDGCIGCGYKEIKIYKIDMGKLRRE